MNTLHFVFFSFVVSSIGNCVVMVQEVNYLSGATFLLVEYCEEHVYLHWVCACMYTCIRRSLSGELGEIIGLHCLHQNPYCTNNKNNNYCLNEVFIRLSLGSYISPTACNVLGSNSCSHKVENSFLAYTDCTNTRLCSWCIVVIILRIEDAIIRHHIQSCTHQQK